MTDLPSYLRGLEMQLVWKRFDRIGLQRIVQLINKSNQFNLTTRRYTDEDIIAVMADPDAFGLQLRLTDRFGDNGIIAIIIGRLQADKDLYDRYLAHELPRARAPGGADNAEPDCPGGGEAGRPTPGRRVHPDQKERNGQGSLCQAGLYGDGNSDAAGGNRNILDLATFTAAETFIHVVEG